MNVSTGLYRLFSLNIASEIPLPEAVPLYTDAPADVVVRLGRVPRHVHEANDAPGGAWFGVPGREELWFRSPHALYHVQNGNSIVVEPFEQATETGLRLFLLGSAMGFMMIQRGWYPVHGGTVVLDGKAVILTGDTGAGKSTLTSALVEKGSRFLADDVSAVTFHDGKPVVLPAYPQRKLCRDAALELGYDLGTLALISAERQKYAVRGDTAWCDTPMPLGCVVEILPGNEKAPAAVRVTGHESMGLFMKNLYRSFIYRYMGIQPKAMKELLTIIAATPIYHLQRPNGLAHMDETLRLLQGLEMA